MLGGSRDYAVGGILFLEESEDFVVSPDDSYAHGPEKRWDYFREDPLLHVFHSLLHQVG